jgi:hypothetical protein
LDAVCSDASAAVHQSVFPAGHIKKVSPFSVLTLQVALAPAAGHIRKYVTKESFRTRTKLRTCLDIQIHL